MLTSSFACAVVAMFGDEQSLDCGEIDTLHLGIRSGDNIAQSFFLQAMPISHKVCRSSGIVQLGRPALIFLSRFDPSPL
jgi:hypothetical protein